MKNPLYAYFIRRFPGPGTGNYAFQPLRGLPAQLIGGSVWYVQRPIREFAVAPQVYSNHAIPFAGVGGLQHGQIALQGLINPSGT